MELAHLQDLFSYDPVSGLLTRRISRNGNNAKAGDVVGTVDGKGYLHVNVDGKFLRVHRIAFFLYHGWLPEMVDHHDRQRQHNWISNLRPADQTQQHGNISMNPRNTSGYRGVSRNSKSGKWHAQIKLHGKQTYLGRFDTPEEAYECYKVAAIAHFGEAYAAL